MALNHTQLKALKPKDKPYKVTDRDGLYVEVLPSGVMTWRFQYYLHGKREKVTFGRYPDIGLADARKMRDDAAAQVAIGQSPAKDKQAKKAERLAEAARAETFRMLADRWIAAEIAGRSESWQYTVKNWLDLDIYPAIGDKDTRTITTKDIDAILTKVVARGAMNSAAKIRTICVKVFQFGMDNDALTDNPAAKTKPVKTPEAESHRALSVKEIRPFLEALDAVGALTINKLAIRLLMLTLTRKDELRLAKWSEFDLDGGVWGIPAHRMKMRNPHRVYLSRQALEILEQLKPLSRGSEFVFPNNSTISKPIGHTTLNNVIDRLDIDGARFVPHGFRATASSILNEANFRHDVIERQLAHKEPNRVRAVYNQAEYAHERREMLQWWADYIDTLKSGSNISPIEARIRG
ncbi:MAG TPA: integrase arm-type DNA-binding domain-containing protein [Noviherbaspirillum sp.]|nr:integrase arm-type DNA-binding domain-containing protein [Noviherbaspirillum sp.]